MKVASKKPSNISTLLDMPTLIASLDAHAAM